MVLFTSLHLEIDSIVHYRANMILSYRLVFQSCLILLSDATNFSILHGLFLLYFQMKEVATENFQRICQAYEILSDETKRQIYDIYGMEGLTSGLELGPKLNKVEEIKEELERLRRMREKEKASAHFQSSGVILAQLSVPSFLAGDGIMRAYDF